MYVVRTRRSQHGTLTPSSDFISGILLQKLVQAVGLEPTRIVWLRASCPSIMASLAFVPNEEFYGN